MDPKAYFTMLIFIRKTYGSFTLGEANVKANLLLDVVDLSLMFPWTEGETTD